MTSVTTLPIARSLRLGARRRTRRALLLLAASSALARGLGAQTPSQDTTRRSAPARAQSRCRSGAGTGAGCWSVDPLLGVHAGAPAGLSAALGMTVGTPVGLEADLPLQLFGLYEPGTAGRRLSVGAGLLAMEPYFMGLTLRLSELTLRRRDGSRPRYVGPEAQLMMWGPSLRLGVLRGHEVGGSRRLLVTVDVGVGL